MAENSSHTQELRRKKAFLRMILVLGLGTQTLQKLISHFEGPESVVEASRGELRRLSVSDDVIADLLSDHSAERAEAEWQKAAEAEIQVVDMLDDAYPPLLREIYDPPLLLYVRGCVSEIRRPQVAIVGTRRPSPYGVNCAERLAEDLANRGLVITSGLARGIDTAAHRGSLVGGQTVAVFGTGLDLAYPRENRRLADLVVQNGALVSECPLGTPPMPQNFPLRNQILAGMTLGTVVVEAAEQSGSLITARLALDANREVFAIPGPFDSPTSVGPHLLIRQGACLVSDWRDVVEELPAAISEAMTRSAEPNPRTATHEGVTLNERQCRVRDALSTSAPIPIDALLLKLALEASDVYAALVELQLLDLIRQLPGQRYIRKL